MPRVDEVIPRRLEDPTILYVGGFSSRRKGVEFLIQVFSQVVQRRPDAHLVIVGNRDNPHVEELAARLLPIGSYEFAGFSRDPREFMKSATVLVVPSFQEPFGLVALEARSCGLPVVASDVGGLPEVLDYGGAGVLLPPGNYSRWESALVHILDNADYRSKLARAAESRLEAFSVTRMVRDYTRVYEEVLNDSTPQHPR
jgi:glycosyltransferase involved in cell wall biosynthesis